MLDRPILLHIHGGGFSSFATRTCLRRAWVSGVLKRADAVCVVNQQTQKAIHQLRPTARTIVLPNPATMLCGRLTDPESRQVLFLGRLGLTKGTDTLLEAIARLQLARIEADYVLAGDGDVEGARLTASQPPAPDRVKVTGWLDPPNVHRLLHRSSIFCLPSRFEGLPMALLQAMGHGLACIVTPVGGMREVVGNGVSGIHVHEDDPEGLAVAIGSLLGDAALRASLGRAAARRVAQSHAPDRFAQRLDGVYSDILVRRREHAVT